MMVAPRVSEAATTELEGEADLLGQLQHGPAALDDGGTGGDLVGESLLQIVVVRDREGVLEARVEDQREPAPTPRTRHLALHLQQIPSCRRAEYWSGSN